MSSVLLQEEVNFEFAIDNAKYRYIAPLLFFSIMQ